MDKKAQLTIIGSAIILLTVVTITYGFFVSGANNDNPQTATITTGTMELTFADNDTGVAKQMIFGESIEKKFTLENTGTVDATAYLYWKDLINTYLYGSLVYKLEYSETANGTKTVVMNNAYVPRSETATEKILSQILTVPANKMYYYTLTITLVNSETVDQTADLSATFTTGFNIKVEGSNKSAETLAALNLTNQLKTEPKDYNMFDYTYNGYNKIADELMPWKDVITQKEGVNTQGVYAMEDDFGTSYYFRGSKSLNNIVKLGKYNESLYSIHTGGWTYILGTLNECLSYFSDQHCDSYNKIANAEDDMYWRIVRINGDGSLRLMYIGTSPMDVTEPKDLEYSIGRSLFDYFNESNSYLKTYLENWYQRCIFEYDDKISNAQYFSDTSDYGYNEMASFSVNYQVNTFSAINRLDKNYFKTTTHIKPSLKTKMTNQTYGGVYYLKIGLLTADELILSGYDGINAVNSSEYPFDPYTNTNDYYTMTPAYDNPAHIEYVIANNNYVYYLDLVNMMPTVPVINLTPEAAQSLIGTGSTGDPYRLAE